jgi:hypothetical protein
MRNILAYLKRGAMLCYCVCLVAGCIRQWAQHRPYSINHRVSMLIYFARCYSWHGAQFRTVLHSRIQLRHLQYTQRSVLSRATSDHDPWLFNAESLRPCILGRRPQKTYATGVMSERALVGYICDEVTGRGVRSSDRFAFLSVIVWCFLFKVNFLNYYVVCFSVIVIFHQGEKLKIVSCIKVKKPV